jgi:hypothetical protein
MAAIGVVVIAGCADAVAGTPITAVPPSTSVTVTASINPCALLNVTQIQHLGVASRGPDTLGGSRGCSWTKTGQYTVGFDVWDHVGIDQVNSGGNPISHHRVGSHDGRQFEGAFGGCAVSMAITDSSSVDVIVAASNPPVECRLADQFAVLIEPELPTERK